MKNNILKSFFIFFFLIIIIVIYLSTIGIETDRFNSQIKNKIIETNKNLNLDLKKIKLTLNPLKFKIYAQTVGATLFITKRPLPIEFIKSEISLN